MARPRKKWLDYFPFDTGFFWDAKIKRLKTRFGTKGIAVYIRLLCAIYRSGFYVPYDEDLILDVSDDLGISENTTTEIVYFLLSRRMFDAELAKSDKVLTSRSVQLRFQEIKKSSRSVVEVEGKYWLLSPEETCTSFKVRHETGFSGKNKDYSWKNDDKSRKNDTKESKEKESKVYSSSTDAAAPSLEEIRMYAESLTSKENADQISVKFHSYYQKTGWKTRSGTPVIDWKDSLQHWLETEKKDKPMKTKQKRAGDIPKSDNAEAYQSFIYNLDE